jgi:hypothetical protein
MESLYNEFTPNRVKFEYHRNDGGNILVQVLPQKVKQRLTAVRLNCFLIGRWIVKSGRKEILKMSVNLKNRVWMDGLFLNSSNLGWDNIKFY